MLLFLILSTFNFHLGASVLHVTTVTLQVNNSAKTKTFFLILNKKPRVDSFKTINSILTIQTLQYYTWINKTCIKYQLLTLIGYKMPS